MSKKPNAKKKNVKDTKDIADNKDSVTITVIDKSRQSTPNKSIMASEDAVIEQSDDEQIYNSCELSMLEEVKDEASDFLIKSLKRQLTSLEAGGKTRNDHEILKQLKNKEKQTFTNVYATKNKTQDQINKYFTGQQMDDNLMNGGSIGIKTLLEKGQNNIMEDITYGDIHKGLNIAPKKLNLFQAIKYLNNGYEEDITTGLNEYNENYYVLKYEKDINNPEFKEEFKLEEKIKKVEFRNWLYKIEEEKQERLENIYEQEQRVKTEVTIDSSQEKKLKDKQKNKRHVECQERIEQAKDFFKEKREYLADFEEKYSKKYLDKKVPLYRKKINAHKKGSKQQVNSTLEKIHEEHASVHLEDIQRHQAHIEVLKTQLKNEKESKKENTTYPIPMNQKLAFYNNIDMRNNGNQVQTTFIYNSTLKEEKDLDKDKLEEQIKKDYEENLEKGFDSTKKQEKQDSLMGKSKSIYQHYKKMYFAQKKTERFIKKDYDTNTKKIYEGLPEIEKELQKKEYKEKIVQRIERNKSQPPLYLEASRKIGRQNQEKKTYNENTESLPNLKPYLSRECAPPRIMSKNSEIHKNYLTDLHSSRRLIEKSPQKSIMSKFNDLNLQGLEKLMAEVVSLDLQTGQKELSTKFGASYRNVNVDSIVTKSATLNIPQKPAASVYANSLRAKVEILNYLIDDEAKTRDSEKAKQVISSLSNQNYKNVKKSTNKKRDKPNMVSDLLHGQQSGSSIIDNYIKDFEKEKEFKKEMSSQKKYNETLRQNMQQERKKIKLEHAKEKKLRLVKRLLNKNYDLQHMALKTLKSNVDDVRLQESRKSRALKESENEESLRKVPEDIIQKPSEKAIEKESVV